MTSAELVILSKLDGSYVAFASATSSDVLRISFARAKPYFNAAVVLSSPEIDHESVGLLCDAIIRNGGCYLLFFGPQSEKAHDIADAARDRFLGPDPSDQDIIMTTWHEGFDTSDIVFDTFTAQPADKYSSTSIGFVFICLDDPMLARRLSARLRGPDATMREILRGQ